METSILRYHNIKVTPTWDIANLQNIRYIIRNDKPTEATAQIIDTFAQKIHFPILTAATTILLEAHSFPGIAYMHFVALADQVLLEATENYNKRSFRNRIWLSSSSGRYCFSIPLKKGKNQECPIREVEIAYDENWPLKLWKTLVSFYQSAPYFEHYKDSLKTLILSKERYLFDYNRLTTCWLSEIIGLEPSWSVTVDYLSHYNAEALIDLRGCLGLKNPIYGYPYPQVFSSSEIQNLNMSTLDLVLNLGPESKLYLKTCHPNSKLP